MVEPSGWLLQGIVWLENLADRSKLIAIQLAVLKHMRLVGPGQRRYSLVMGAHGAAVVGAIGKVGVQQACIASHKSAA